MYKYIDILSTSIFFMSLYVMYGNYKSSKSKKYIMPIIIIMTIIIINLGKISGGYNILNHINSNNIGEIIIVLFIIQLNIKEKQSKKNKLLINTNYLVGIISEMFILFGKDGIYNEIICIYILMTTFYLFSITINTSRSINKNAKILIIFNFSYILLGLVLPNIKETLYLGNTLKLISSVYIFDNLLKKNVTSIYTQMDDVTSKLRRSNIIMKIYGEKLDLNKKISNIIYSNLEKKSKILDLILDQCNRCVLLIDEDGYILNEDDAFSKMWKEYKDCKYKIKLTTFLNKSIKNYVDFLSSINKVNTTYQEVNSELVGKDGRFFNCTYAPFIIQDKKIGVICVITDITYKKKSEIKIKENNIKYKKIVDNIPYSILLANSRDIIYNNEKNEYIDFYKDDIKNIILDTSTNGEIHYVANNGFETCLNINRVSFLEGYEHRNLIVIRDITNYKNLLRAVEYNKRKYEALVNIIPEGIYISNFENRLITYANDTFLDMVGLSDVEDMEIDSINKDIIITSGNTNDSVKFEKRIIKNMYEEEIHIESGAMLIDVNQRLKLVGIVRDITEQVKAEMIEREIEERERANKIKNEFFVNMSHELKTPLNLIYSSNQLLEILCKDEILSNPQGELSTAISIVNKHSYMLIGLINNIMDLAKLESDFYNIKRDYYNIIDIVEYVVDEFNKCIQANNISIVFDTDEEEKIANVDPDDIEKIILTLLSLIVRYSKNKSTINVDLNSSKNKTKVSIKNINGYDYHRYTNDQERRNLDIGITVANLIINLYDGWIDIKTNNKDEMSIVVEIKVDEYMKEYKEREKNKSEDFIYAEYTRMCNF
ncbi:MAG: HAMP domain-containing sensor histidine kinase [Romboutsia sp.]